MADVLNTSYIFASFLVSRKSNVDLKHSLKTKTAPTFLLNLAPFNSYFCHNSIKIDMSSEILQSEWCLRTPESECLFEKTLSHTHSSLWVDFLSSPPFLLFAFTSCQIHPNPFKGRRLNMTIIFTFFSRGRSHYLHHLTQNRQSPSQSLEVDAIAIWMHSAKRSHCIQQAVSCLWWLEKILKANIFLVFGWMLIKKQGGIRLQSRWKADTLCIMNLKLHIHVSSKQWTQLSWPI